MDSETTENELARGKTAPIPEFSPEISGEEKGAALILKGSELAILRRRADKYPVTPGERKEVVESVMSTMRNSKSNRTKIMAARTMAALDRINHDELKLFVDATSKRQDLQPANITNNLMINNLTITPSQFDALSLDDQLRLLRGEPILPASVRPVEPAPLSNDKPAPTDQTP
jgi:hypothetical protein